ncbi:FAD/FMN-containing dehydrogenase [Paraburkholderia sp. BL8N3]|jgi:FAD/FMN-containing dehydrogenase|nr:FAD-binding protein [Paraburkholderia sp. BL8N3]TCK34579.1 FAD/FMN-containing dehydrogenase [Paraburkholderia sp. BL8N3]
MTPAPGWYDPYRARWLAAPDAGSVRVPALEGRLCADLPSREAASSDWGQVVRGLPSAVLHPASASDIASMVRFCRSLGIRIGARGQAHTMHGHAQVAGGVAIDMRSLNRIHSITPGHASVDAGVIWRDLLRVTVAQGLTPPVLTDYLALSVGGTLSVGGLNGTTFRHGMQVDHVRELEVITGEGDVLTCSMSQHRDLFEAVLGGLGQCAIIARASVALMPAPARARVFDMAYPDLGALLADFRTLLFDARFGYVQALLPALPAGGFNYILQGVSFDDAGTRGDAALLHELDFVPGGVEKRETGYFDFCDRVTATQIEIGAAGHWNLPHPWIDVFVPERHARRYIDGVLSELTFSDVPDFPCLIYGFRKSRLTRPLPRTPGDEVFFLFDVLRTTDPARIAQAVAGNRRFYEDAVSLGGGFYPVSAVPLTQEDWQRHFGAAYEPLARAKSRYDPAGILTPGPGIFG